MPRPGPGAPREALYEYHHKRYERDVAGIAARLREFADEVERRGARLGSPLFGEAPHASAAAMVVSTTVQLQNLHLDDLVRDAADADRYYPDPAPKETDDAPDHP